MANNADEDLPPYTPIAEPPPTPATTQASGTPRAHSTEPNTSRSSLAHEVDESIPPPAYDSPYGTLDIHENALDTSAQITVDGRVNIKINQKSRHFSALLSKPRSPPSPTIPTVPAEFVDVPRLNIVIQLIGSRGDIQPFLALADELVNTHGHRVRLATHPVFKSFVEDVPGLEFFSLGGDPGELMAFMVKNPGLVPGVESLKNGEVSKRRRGMMEVLEGAWKSCIEDGFVCDAIIANPPSFAHVHCAEKLGVPLHLMFTMPWSATAAFPHPLANVQSTNADMAMTNYLSYALVDMMTWQGLGDLVNKFREKTLGLEGISTMWAPSMISRLKVPHTYAWSPALIPKPKDWSSELDISGFFFLSLGDRYTPPPDLQKFLAAGPPPVYIGFGSIVVDDPNKLTATILEAIERSGCRALLSKGWGGIGAGELNIPETVFLIDNCPHDWLFSRCAAVVHHGGAGTTAAAIRAGKPSVIVPFFGDQPFWGQMVARAGAGPDPIHNKSLNAENLSAGITTCLTPEVQAKAESMGAQIRSETGAKNGAQGFLQRLKIDKCDVIPSRVAVWRTKTTGVKLSALAAEVLVSQNHLVWDDLRLHRHTEWAMDEGPTDPISGGAGALVGTMGTIALGAGDFPRELFKALTGSSKSTTGEPSSPPSAASPSSPLSRTPTFADTLKHASAATGSVGQIVGAGIKSPMDFTLSLARGFRNAPKLYGDTTVRPPPKVTGYQSGLRASAKELGMGFFEGVAGLVTQPLQGAKEGGGAGFIKGAGRGIGGLVLKSGAGIWGVPGYAMQGVHREFLKLSAKDSTPLILETRKQQGKIDAQGINERMTQEILGKMVTALNTAGKRKKLFDFKSKKLEPELETAVKQSVATTSCGDDEEDAAVEAAIRASLAEMQLQTPTHTSTAPSYTPQDEDEGLKLALERSRTDAHPSWHDPKEETADDALLRAIEASRLQDAPDENEDLERVLRESRQQQQHCPTDEDEELRRVMEESRRQHPQTHGTNNEEDEELRRVIAESEREARGKRLQEEDDEDLLRAMRESLADARGGGGGEWEMVERGEGSETMHGAR